MSRSSSGREAQHVSLAQLTHSASLLRTEGAKGFSRLSDNNKDVGTSSATAGGVFGGRFLFIGWHRDMVGG